MPELLYGKPVADSIFNDLSERVKCLSENGIEPTLAIIRVGNSESDISYEKGIMKRTALLGIRVNVLTFEETVSPETLIETVRKLNEDEGTHGIMVFRPLPGNLKAFERSVVNTIAPEKDVDGATEASLACVLLNEKKGFCPCTPEACITIIDYYKVELSGKNITVIGRSSVVGKPVALLLTDRNATVTVCHTKTRELARIAKMSDILIAAAGKPGLVTADFLNESQVVVDVSVNFNEATGKLVGDVEPGAEQYAHAVTPVPGGVGAVTSMILMSHIIRAAEMAARKQI